MKAIQNPRSILHALQPIGQGTSEVESLLSYFCRLAVSHSTSTLILSRTVAERVQHEISPNYDWHERQISGVGESAMNWSCALSALTTVEGLDALTFLPWRNVIAQNGLSMVPSGQFCPQCLAEDRSTGRIPYFRLAWESAEVSVCQRHKVPLQRHCQHCGKDKIRHSAAFVVPGWCTHCGHFLGSEMPIQNNEVGIEPAALWRARQIGELLASQDGLVHHPQRDSLISTITHIITELDGGQSAAFARRIGIGKSTVHHWLKGPGIPKLGISLQIALQCGVSLANLLTGEIKDWQPPLASQQLGLGFSAPLHLPRATARILDWDAIEAEMEALLKLPTPISVLDAASRLDVEARQLYLRVNRVTRILGQRWLAYMRQRQEATVVKAWPYLETACKDLLRQGKSVTRRDILLRVPAQVVNTVPHLHDVLKDVQAHLLDVSLEYPAAQS